MKHFTYNKDDVERVKPIVCKCGISGDPRPDAVYTNFKRADHGGGLDVSDDEFEEHEQPMSLICAAKGCTALVLLDTETPHMEIYPCRFCEKNYLCKACSDSKVCSSCEKRGAIKCSNRHCEKSLQPQYGKSWLIGKFREQIYCTYCVTRSFDDPTSLKLEEIRCYTCNAPHSTKRKDLTMCRLCENYYCLGCGDKKIKVCKDCATYHPSMAQLKHFHKYDTEHDEPSSQPVTKKPRLEVKED